MPGAPPGTAEAVADCPSPGETGSAATATTPTTTNRLMNSPWPRFRMCFIDGLLLKAQPYKGNLGARQTTTISGIGGAVYDHEIVARIGQDNASGLDGCRGLSSAGLSETPSSGPGRPDDILVARAHAEVARDGLAHLVVGGIRAI